jgi:hypothetical protein
MGVAEKINFRLGDHPLRFAPAMSVVLILLIGLLLFPFRQRRQLVGSGPCLGNEMAGRIQSCRFEKVHPERE